MNAIEEKLISFRCPRWHELPDVELYMDQLVGYAERHLEALDVTQEGRLITPSMINNYVKMKLIPAPVKKKYGVRQISRLLVICSLKRDFSISELQEMMGMVLKLKDKGCLAEDAIISYEHSSKSDNLGKFMEEKGIVIDILSTKRFRGTVIDLFRFSS